MPASSLPRTDVALPLIDSLYRMAWLVEARDPYTGGHLWRVSQFARLLAEDLAWPASDVARVSLGGFLHDLGKIGVPDAILNKRDKLTDEEYETIKTHPAIGERLIHGHPLAAWIGPAIFEHHERPDGLGYPAGRTQDDISADARIVGLCDAFDAMTSTRPYREGMPVERALAILNEEAGRQFDARLVRHFVALGETGRLDAIVGHSDLGIPLQLCGACGPTIVVRRDQKPGEVVYCRCCGAQARIETMGREGDVRIAATGRRGDAAQLEMEVDEPLLAGMVVSAVTALLAAPDRDADGRTWIQRWFGR
ncbi:HD-GYP domain-containing protein [Paludibacterium paludis]|uniref:HD-GYP domain-containing protein n=1 Tax=Paludibacterium paludis TaxID=1225769 RepID=A0A918P022_9NEIS|nr:HD-GYP domain-containing protein [Paludibacterium paludis]GGY09452.1 hypothetical protein GCM10011289_10290 [Paludibacterium paludis]